MTPWPKLPSWAEWGDTLETFHMWTQIVGKVRTKAVPWINHGWQVTLYVTPRGLTTGLMPHGESGFQIDFDLVDERLVVAVTDGRTGFVPLESQTTAVFYERLMSLLSELGVPVAIDRMPNEVAEPIPFDRDETHATFDPDHARTLWRALIDTERVFTRFRSRFLGKCSPVHLFWGSLDLAVTRFSGRTAPEHPGGIPNLPDRITREAYSHEVTSVGFWPGNADADPFFYSYAYPTPEGFSEASVRPEQAFWLGDLGEFALPYEAVRTSDDPDETLMAYLQSTYVAAAELLEWDREALEREEGPPRD